MPHESRFGCTGFLSQLFLGLYGGGWVIQEKRGGGGELGKQRTGTTIVLHVLNVAPVVEYLLMSLSWKVF